MSSLRFRFSCEPRVTFSKLCSCTDDWNVIDSRCCQFWCQTTSSDPPERSLGTDGGRVNAPASFLCRARPRQRAAPGFTSAVKHPAAPPPGLCFWVVLTYIHLERRSERKSSPQGSRPHTTNFPFNYGPSVGFTLNQTVQEHFICSHWNVLRSQPRDVQRNDAILILIHSSIELVPIRHLECLT